ncbi:Uncharacterized protein PECH_001455 [Penicillium ucsense]|uniref:Uncharacterized protein n=1 Tax=Penicillium ucsense TaxID=2839758 RepID=A0A8J8WJF0_9EURO|nr:Uncharacterized protein PECM_001095 [Penicillium ucsense]KAF7738227.1 Uncharacterized protein PECH_001455 [Penicillium ucsense]
MFGPSTRNEWLFCGPLLLQALIVPALQIYTLVEWQEWVNPNITQVTVGYIVPINLVIFVFTCLYLVVLAFDAVHHKNNLLLFAICASNVCITVFSGLQPRSMKEAIATLPEARDANRQPLVNVQFDFIGRVYPALVACPVVFGICTALIWPFAYRLHKDYAWAIYRTIHGNTSIKIRYIAYEVYLVLIKSKFYFITVFIIQYDLIDVHFQQPEFALTLAILPASFIMMALAIWAVRKEWTLATIFVILSHGALAAYFVSRIVVLNGNGELANTADKAMMLLFAYVSLVLMIGTLFCAAVCVYNFNHGLKDLFEGLSLERDHVDFQALPRRSEQTNSQYSRLSFGKNGRDEW